MKPSSSSSKRKSKKSSGSVYLEQWQNAEFERDFDIDPGSVGRLELKMPSHHVPCHYSQIVSESTSSYALRNVLKKCSELESGVGSSQVSHAKTIYDIRRQNSF